MSAGEPYLSDTLLAQPPNSSLMSLGHSTFRSLELKECLKLWQVGAPCPNTALIRLLTAADADVFFVAFLTSSIS